MTAPAVDRWSGIDPGRRRELDAQFLAELATWDIPGLTDEDVRMYLDYRRERPEAAITTFEEGQIRRMLRHRGNPGVLPDPVELEDHPSRIDKFGAEVLHLTNAKTYVVLMVTLTLAFVVTLLAWTIWL